MKCYAKNCEQTVTAFCILDDSVACETHVVGDYFREMEVDEFVKQGYTITKWEIQE